MMKKHILICALSLFTISAFAQKKKAPPIKKPVLEAPPVAEPGMGSNSGEYPVMIPESAMTHIVGTKKNGQEVQFKDWAELEKTDFSQFKKFSFSTRFSDKSLEATILKRILNEAISLESLEISNFKIESFPEITSSNKSLKELSLSRNNLQTLPASVSNLTALEKFQSSNPLTELPESFAQLKNLKELGLDNNEFSEFPTVVFSLNKLTVLHVSGPYKGSAKIKVLPDQFQQLPNLKEFGVSNASLSALPPSISTLKKLETASFAYNQFTSFPEVLATNINLSYVPFSGNPLQWELFLPSIKKIKWRGLFFLNETNFTKKQYQEIQKILNKIDVYYEGMND